MTFSSPKGLFEFQVRGVARWMLQRAIFCSWETGTGKSMLPLAGGSMLFDEGSIGLLMVVCEQNKVQEWEKDFETFTGLKAVRYMGTVAKRAKIRDTLGSPDGPQVIITTYDTSRNDLGRMVKKEFVEGPLLDTLRTLAPDGVGIVYDESSRIGNRYVPGHFDHRLKAFVATQGSVTYLAHEHMLTELRAITDKVWVAAMTATKVERSPENFYNQMRLLAPQLAPSLDDFERDYVVYRPLRGTPSYKNISPNDFHREKWVTPLSDIFESIIDHKSKNDPDVRAAFPVATEEPVFVTLAKDHKALYDAIEMISSDEDFFPEGMKPEDEQVLFGILRQVAAHPQALLLSPAAAKEGTIANRIVQHIGEATLAKMKCAKEDDLVKRLGILAKGQGAQVIVFTFFGRSVLPLLQRRLTAEGFSVAPYHGEMSHKAKDDSLAGFRSGKQEILLASDSGSRGLNIPEAQYVVNYEMCLTHGRTVQRINRVNRLGSQHASVTAISMVARDTIEEPILNLNFRRQDWEEQLTPDAESDDQDDLGMLGVEDRKALFEQRRVLA